MTEEERDAIVARAKEFDDSLAAAWGMDLNEADEPPHARERADLADRVPDMDLLVDDVLDLLKKTGMGLDARGDFADTLRTWADAILDTAKYATWTPGSSQPAQVVDYRRGALSSAVEVLASLSDAGISRVKDHVTGDFRCSW